MSARSTGRHPHAVAAVAAVLDARGTAIAARIALCAAYLLGGATKLADLPAAVAEQRHFGMPVPALSAAATIAVELIGPALILSGRAAWLGAGMLGVFTALAAIVANGFWTLHGAARGAAANAFFEHVGLVGGFLLVAIADRRARPE